MIISLYVLILTSISCSLLGVFLILRKISMLTDAISHTVLLGIVIAYFFVRDLSSPFLIVGAASTGLLTVILVELLGKSKLAKYEDAIGIIFPVLFSIAVILISRYFSSVHLDIDIVLLGEVVFASLIKTTVFGIEVHKAILHGAIMLFIILTFIIVFYKELKTSTFEPDYAALLGIQTGFIFYSLMTLTSFTSVVSFNNVGGILVISFFIAPAATALILSKRLHHALILSAIISVFNCAIAYLLAVHFNASMSGMCAFINTITYLSVLIFTKLYKEKKVERAKYDKRSSNI